MTMTEPTLEIAAGIFELLVPVLCIALLFVFPNQKHRLASVIGALGPVLFIMSFFFLMFLISPQSPHYTFPSVAGLLWLMSLPLYATCLLIGIIAAAFKRPVELKRRFLLSFAIGGALPLVLIVSSFVA